MQPLGQLVTLMLLTVTHLTAVSGLTCHVCRTEPGAAAAAPADSTLGLIVTLALHAPPDCGQFSVGEERFRTVCPAGLNTTCAIAEDAAGRRVRTCFSTAGGVDGCRSDADGTFCLCRTDLCNTAADSSRPLGAALLLTVGLAMSMW